MAAVSDLDRSLIPRLDRNTHLISRIPRRRTHSNSRSRLGIQHRRPPPNTNRPNTKQRINTRSSRKHAARTIHRRRRRIRRPRHRAAIRYSIGNRTRALPATPRCTHRNRLRQPGVQHCCPAAYADGSDAEQSVSAGGGAEDAPGAVHWLSGADCWRGDCAAPRDGLGDGAGALHADVCWDDGLLRCLCEHRGEEEGEWENL